jgi:hypothetical protein
MFTKRFAFLLILSALLAACATQPMPASTEAPTATATPVVVSTLSIQPTIAASITPEPTAANTANSAWVAYRDPRYGIGVAYPCWWIMNPIPADGNGGALTLRSFDEDYFRAHSTKGFWTDGIVPEGVFAVDLVVFEQIDPAKSTLEAYAGLIDPSQEAIVSSEERRIGQNQTTVIQIQNLVNNKDPLFTAYLFRLAPDKLLLFATQQQDRLDSADLQGILTSLSLSPEQPVMMPTATPHLPLIAAACLSK